MINGEKMLRDCRELSDEQLLSELGRLTTDERLDLIKVLVRLAEMDRRELAKEKGYSSLFKYCVKKLKYCEGTAFYRSKTAEACAKFPVLLELIEQGELTVMAVALLADSFTFENHQGLIRQAQGATRKQIEGIVAGLHPESKPPERTRIIAVPTRSAASEGSPAPVTSDFAAPRAQDELDFGSRIELRVEHRFSVPDATEAKLARARELLSHKFPLGDLESIFDAALEALLDRIDPERRKARTRPDAEPRPLELQTRRIPCWVKRKVRERDQDRCAYESPDGVRCEERRFLQLDHVIPWSEGGRSDDPGNIRQLCASHNRWRARTGN